MSSGAMLQGDGRLRNVTVNIGNARRRDSTNLLRRESFTPSYGQRTAARTYSSAGGGTGGRRWSESSNHSSMTTSRRINAVGAIFESPHINVGTQIVMVAPAFLYAIAVVMWLFEDQDIEFARELAPVSFAALCVHLFAAGEIPYLTFWEVVHYWFHAACEVLVANDYTRKIGGGVWGVFLTSVLMLMFWPTGWVMLRRLRIKINHPSRISRFPNVGESAMRAGLPLLGLSLYLGTQSLSCLVYEGVTDCTLKNSGKRHLNYSLGTLYVLLMLFKHLTGSNAKQVMLFRLRHHQSFAVVFSLLSTMYSLYEYAASGIPYRDNVAELMADLVMFLFWFLSIVTIINAAPREHTPPILYLSTVIPDTTLQIESLEVAPDGAFTESDRKRLSMGPLLRDRGPLGRMLRDTNRPLSMSHRGPLETALGGSPRILQARGFSPSMFPHDNAWIERSSSLHGDGRQANRARDDGPLSCSAGKSTGALDDLDDAGEPRQTGDERQPEREEEKENWDYVFFMRDSRAFFFIIVVFCCLNCLHPVTSNAAAVPEAQQPLPDGRGETFQGGNHLLLLPTEYTHPLLKYYRTRGRIPPLSFCVTYLCEIVFFWRAILFIFTVGYKIFLSLAAYYIMNRHWAQIFTPISTSALTVSWLLTLGIDPRDRVSNQMMNLHFWFHALSEIPDILVWFKNGQNLEVIFNVLILLIVWPWVYVAYRRVLTTLRAKYRGQEEDTSVKLFWEGSLLMTVEFYLAFQANGCLVHAPSGRESSCDNLIHSNLISGMNIILIFLVVRVMLFKLGDLTITRTLHLELRPYEILVVVFSVISGLVSLYFLANREYAILAIGEVRQVLEWSTMGLWIVVCLLMAHLTPAHDSVRAQALAELVMTSSSGDRPASAAAASGVDQSGATNVVIPPGLDEAADDLALVMAAERRKKSRSNSHTHSPTRNSPAPASARLRNGTNSAALPGKHKHWTETDDNGHGYANANGPLDSSAAGYDTEDRPNSTLGRTRLPTPTLLPLEMDGDDEPRGGRCCCACWYSFAFWMDKRNTQNNLPVFRLLYFSSTVVYFVVMLGVAAGFIKRGYATAVVGVSFASVCSHWLISIEHPTSTMEAVHLLLHACTEAISVLLWVSVRDWTQAVYTLSAFFAVYPCLFYGIQALKLGLHRKFSNYLALVREAMKIFLRSSVLLMVLMYLAFECIGCLNANPEGDCTALLYANTQARVGLSVVLGFLSFLGLIVMQDITARHFLQLSFTCPQQLAVVTFSLVAMGLCIFSLASRHSDKLTTDIWEHMVELATLFSWYAALLILWIRRPWYDTTDEDLDEQIEGSSKKGRVSIHGMASKAMGSLGGGLGPDDWVPTPDWTEEARAAKDANLV
ncbi:unnamed protein product [Ascophyllum nodosum]